MSVGHERLYHPLRFAWLQQLRLTSTSNLLYNYLLRWLPSHLLSRPLPLPMVQIKPRPASNNFSPWCDNFRRICTMRKPATMLCNRKQSCVGAPKQPTLFCRSLGSGHRSRPPWAFRCSQRRRDHPMLWIFQGLICRKQRLLFTSIPTWRFW